MANDTIDERLNRRPALAASVTTQQTSKRRATLVVGAQTAIALGLAVLMHRLAESTLRHFSFKGFFVKAHSQWWLSPVGRVTPDSGGSP